TRELYLSGSLKAIAEWRLEHEAPSGSDDMPSESLLEDDAALQGWLAEQLGRLTAIPQSELQADTPLTNFGVDSIVAVSYSHRIESVIGVNIGVDQLMEGLTLRQLANEVLNRKAGSTGSVAGFDPVVHLTAKESDLSQGQKGLWYLQKLHPDSSVHNIAAAARIRSFLDVPAVRRCLHELVLRHSALRTEFSTS